MVYADEVDVHLNPKIGPDWMLPRTQRLVLTPGKNEKRYIAGAYEPLHDRLVYVEGDRKASWIFLNLLRALIEAYDEAEKIHVILDNYIIHKGRLAQMWLAEHGARLQLHFLPPSCPKPSPTPEDIRLALRRLHDALPLAGQGEEDARFCRGVLANVMDGLPT